MKQNVLFLLIIIIFYSCKTSKNNIKINLISKEETRMKKESTKQLVDFFNAENARLLGKNENAIQLYTLFIKKHPQNATAFYNLSRLNFAKKNNLEAEHYAKTACSLSSKNNYFREFYTQTLLYNNKLKEAENQYDLLVSNNPNNAEYIFKKAQLNIKEKEYEKAIENLNLYEFKTGFNEDISIQKKNIFMAMNKPTLALEELNKLQNYNSQNVEYSLMLIDLLEELNKQEDLKYAYKDLEKKHGDNLIVQTFLAEYYLKTNNQVKYDLSIQKLVKNKNISTENKIALLIPIINKISVDSNNDKLLELVKSVANESPTNKEAILIYANSLSLANKPLQSIEEYKRYLQLDKSKLDVWTQVIATFFDNKMYDSAIKYCDSSITYFSSNSIPYFYKGISFLQKENTASAILNLNKSLEFEKENKPLQAQIYSTLGDAYNSSKNYLKSDSSFEKALMFSPNDVTILNNYAYYLSVRKYRLDDAEKMSKKSLELQPNSKSFLDTYGWILFQQGNYTEAKNYIEKAINISSEIDGTLFDHLGDVYYKLNNIDKAIENWNKALKSGISNKEILNKIKERKLNE